MHANRLFSSLLVSASFITLTACNPAQQPSQDTSEASVKQYVIEATPQPEQPDYDPYVSGVVAAINFGGPVYEGSDGIVYQADTFDLPYQKNQSSDILGSQDPTLFETYRLGDNNGQLSLSIPVDNGTYAVTFKFAEPESTDVGDRVFDVVAEGETVIDDLDVRLARDGKILSELSRSVTNVNVADNQLDILLDGSVNTPLLHALVVRRIEDDPRDWQLVWSDEFDYEGKPDESKWRYNIWPARKVNDEDQAYTDRLKNARVEDGRLIIEAHKEQYDNAEYTSARLHNMGTGDFLYGKVDISVRVPAGQGTWAAAWMLPSDPFKYASSCEQGADWQGSATCDAWPNSGEIDILEHVGYDMQRLHGTVHNKAYYWRNWQQRKASLEGRNVDEAFHEYSLEWTPDYIIILFNDVPYFYYKNEGTGWQAWPFDHPYHVILNLAIGGAWGRAGGPIDDSIFPVQMEVDYVRIYQLAEKQQ
ncbi:malectin domain-containing carbohydrate-binding protein [Aestuariibacter salexigens]|uniref:malectin domain-containing carbohydrate-binding protein n=1 Tax=Aestuariibacter salexigens TaxID=226010 RepID=UPI0004166C30|nr:malectin domain-containing carbohydrate-binding protein [Aestuariibacter salexigens]